jgi:hypothetical protein
VCVGLLLSGLFVCPVLCCIVWVSPFFNIIDKLCLVRLKNYDGVIFFFLRLNSTFVVFLIT